MVEERRNADRLSVDKIVTIPPINSHRLHEAGLRSKWPPIRGEGPCHTLFSQPPRVLTMDKDSRRQQRQNNVLSTLNVAIEGLNLTKEVLNITPAKAVCGSVSVVLTMIRVCFPLVRVDRCGLNSIQDSMINETDYVELGLACAEICTALGRGMDGKKMEDLSQSVSEAIGQLTT